MRVYGDFNRGPEFRYELVRSWRPSPGPAPSTAEISRTGPAAFFRRWRRTRPIPRSSAWPASIPGTPPAGAFPLLSPRSQPVSPYTYALLAAGVWGRVSLLEKLGLARADPMIGLIFRCTGVLIDDPAFLFRPDLGSGFRSAGLRSALCFMASGFLASVVGQVFALNALKRADASGSAR